MKKKNVLLVIIVVLVCIAALALVLRKQLADRGYEKVHPHVGEITEAVYGLGKVKTDQRYEVKLGVVSTVQRVFVREGDFVKQGQKLLELDSGTAFKAPFDGTVTLVSVHEGETAGSQSVLLRLENLENRYLELALEQEGAMRVKRGQTARVSFESQRGQVLMGRVTSLFPKDNDFIVNVDVQGLDASVLPGMSADVSVEVGKVTGRLVPLKAIRNGLLTVERNGKVQKMKVEVGLVDGLSAEILGTDLSETDEIWVPKD